MPLVRAKHEESFVFKPRYYIIELTNYHSFQIMWLLLRRRGFKTERRIQLFINLVWQPRNLSGMDTRVRSSTQGRCMGRYEAGYRRTDKLSDFTSSQLWKTS